MAKRVNIKQLKEESDGIIYYIVPNAKSLLKAGYIYCDDKADSTYPAKITVTTADHDINYVMLRRNDLFLMNMRYYFEKGCFRFKNLQCKDAILKALSY